MTSHSLDPYGVLGVDRNATRDQIRTSYRAFMRRMHPDLAAELYAEENPEASNNRKALQAVQDAYDLLCDDTRREAYDRTVSPPVSIPVQPQPPPSDRFASSRKTPGFGTQRYDPPANAVILVELSPNQCLKGGEVEFATDHLPLILPYPPGIPNGFEIATSLGTIVLLYASTPTAWIAGRDLYRRFPVRPEQIVAGARLFVTVGGRQFPVQLDPLLPVQEFFFPGAGLPAFGDYPVGDLYLIPCRA